MINDHTLTGKMTIYGVYLGDFEGGGFDSYYLEKNKAIIKALEVLEEKKKDTKGMQEHEKEIGFSDNYKDWIKSTDREDEWKGDYNYEYSISVEEVEVIE